jgi:CRISPR/Cas system-associated endonuclease Cas3-HD
MRNDKGDFETSDPVVTNLYLGQHFTVSKDILKLNDINIKTESAKAMRRASSKNQYQFLMWLENHPAESAKMYVRLFYNIVVW